MRVDLTEYGPCVEVTIPLEVGMALAAGKLVAADPVPGSPLWRLTPGSKVGALRVGGVEVHVAPKVPIERVVFLLAYGHHRVDWHQDTVQVRSAPELLVAVVEAFERLTSKALLRGLLQGYRSVEESLAVVRGRIREADPVKRRFAMPLPVEVRYDDFTVDTPENRLLRAALRRSLRLGGLPEDLRHRLRRLDLLLRDVAPVEPALLDPWQPSRLNARLLDALRLAEVIVAGTSFEPSGTGLAVSGFVVDMAKVFEDFVCAALGERLRAVEGQVRPQDVWRLDRAGRVRMRPDLVWYAADGSCAAVVDAKYKAERPGGFPDADLYQMLAYCTAMRLPVGHLVYAKGNEHGATHQVVGAEITLRAHVLDLALDPAALLTQMDGLAARIARSRLAANGAEAVGTDGARG